MTTEEFNNAMMGRLMELGIPSSFVTGLLVDAALHIMTDEQKDELHRIANERLDELLASFEAADQEASTGGDPLDGLTGGSVDPLTEDNPLDEDKDDDKLEG